MRTVRGAAMSGRRVEGFVPYLPAGWLSPNRGERKEGRVPLAIGRAKKAFRTITATYLGTIDQVRAVKEPFGYARLSCIYYCTTPRAGGLYRASDVTNAIYAHKAFYDGFKDAGLIVDDDWKHLELGIQRVRRVNDPSEEGIHFILEEVDFDS